MLQVEKFIETLKEECFLRKFSKETVKTYSFHVKNYLDYININLLNLQIPEVKRYLKYQNLSVNSIRLKYMVLKFFYTNVLKHPFNFEGVPVQKKRKQLSKILSKKQMKLLINSCKNIKHKIVITFLYSGRFRISELINLKIQYIDFEKNLINICIRKGKKYGEKSIQLIISLTEERIDIKVTPHLLRHSFASHLLEAGINIKYFHKLLGHSDVKTTEIYTHVSNKNLENIKLPLDCL
ncbi:MAG: tyrosine-type recombinase/integrase [Candidatus Pacearchaeota archaeon]|nr:tyrosine-type recombinase/integrase [Candidatus Pacearchaeota archaeon]